MTTQPANQAPKLSSDPRFRAYFARHLQPLAERYEANRLEALKERNQRLSGALPFFIALVVCLFVLLSRGTDFSWWVSGFFIFLTALFLGIWCWFPTLVHAVRLEEQILPRLVPFFGDLKIQWDRDLSLKQFAAWHVLPNYDESRTRDVIEGSYRGAGLLFAEITLNRRIRRHGDSGTSIEKVFDGFLLAIKPNRPSFTGHTLVVTAGFFDPDFRLEDSVDWLPVPVIGGGFQVLADESALADICITPASLIRLEALQQRIGAKRMLLSFHQDRVVMLVEHKDDYFEIPTSKKTDFARDAQIIGEQLANIFAFVDAFELGDATFDDTLQYTPKAPAESDLQADHPEVYNYRAWGWGCLPVFIVFVALILPVGLFLQNTGSAGDLNSGDTALGLGLIIAFLLSTGLHKIFVAVKKGSIGALIFALILLSAAVGIVYAKAPERLASVQACFSNEAPLMECFRNLYREIEGDGSNSSGH